MHLFSLGPIVEWECWCWLRGRFAYMFSGARNQTAQNECCWAGDGRIGLQEYASGSRATAFKALRTYTQTRPLPAGGVAWGRLVYIFNFNFKFLEFKTIDCYWWWCRRILLRSECCEIASRAESEYPGEIIKSAFEGESVGWGKMQCDPQLRFYQRDGEEVSERREVCEEGFPSFLYYRYY